MKGTVQRSAALFVGLFVVGCDEGPQPACDARSSFEMDYNDGSPIFRMDLASEDGEAWPTTLSVIQSHEDAKTPAEACSMGGRGIWDIGGSFNEIAYPEAPENAVVFFDVEEHGETGLTKDLIDGEIYVAHVGLGEPRMDSGVWAWISRETPIEGRLGAASCADDWSVAWIQGDPSSVVYCRGDRAE